MGTWQMPVRARWEYITVRFPSKAYIFIKKCTVWGLALLHNSDPSVQDIFKDLNIITKNVTYNMKYDMNGICYNDNENIHSVWK